MNGPRFSAELRKLPTEALYALAEKVLRWYYGTDYPERSRLAQPHALLFGECDEREGKKRALNGHSFPGGSKTPRWVRLVQAIDHWGGGRGLDLAECEERDRWLAEWR